MTDWWRTDPRNSWRHRDGQGGRILVRMLGVSDLAAVARLSADIYRFDPELPLDYVTAKYARYCFSSNNLPVGLFLLSDDNDQEGELAAFALYAYIDDGRTLFKQALRTAPAHRERGLSFFLMEGALRIVPPLAARMFPRLHRSRSAKIVSLKHDTDTAGVIAEKHMHLFRTDDFLDLLDRFDAAAAVSCRRVGFAEAHRFVQRHAALLQRPCTDVAAPAAGVPSLLVVDWVGYEPSMENLALLELGGRSDWEHEIYLASRGGDGDPLTAPSSNVALCLAAVTHRACGPLLDLTVYTDDLACLTACLRQLFDRRTGTFWSSSPLCTTSESRPPHVWMFFDATIRQALQRSRTPLPKSLFLAEKLYVYEHVFPETSRL